MSSDITDEVAAAAAVLKGTVHDRTSFLDCLPYKLARLRAPGVAEQVLQRFDSMSEEGVPHHRVSAHFLAKDSRLRTHVVALAAGEALHFELAQELMGIEWGLISEVDIEGEHRNLGLEKQRAHAVGHAFAVATVRINENRETLSAVRRDPILSRLFLSCWKSWKAVAEDPKIVSKMWLRLSPQVRKRSFRETTSIAYRLGKSSFADFSNLKGLFVDKTSRQQPLQGGDCEKLLSDYVQSSIEIEKFTQFLLRAIFCSPTCKESLTKFQPICQLKQRVPTRSECIFACFTPMSAVRRASSLPMPCLVAGQLRRLPKCKCSVLP